MLRSLIQHCFTICVPVALASAVSACTPDFETLSNCDVPEPCPPSGADLIEGMHLLHERGARCVLEALRDGAPGRYVHKTSTNVAYGGPQVSTDYVLVVSASGEARYAWTSQGSLSSSPPPPRLPPPAQRCQLKPASYYQACLDALASFDRYDLADPAWRCVYTSVDSWLDDCVTESPARCE